MKVGDNFPVTIAGQVVCQAVVKEMQDGTVTLLVPATLVVMGTRVELTDEGPAGSDSEVIITGADRPENNSADEAPVEIKEPAEGPVEGSDNE